MENELDRTIFAKSEADLERIQEEESQKLKEAEFIFECLKKLRIEDFPSDLPAESKKNIENALLTARIHENVDIGGGLKLFGLQDISSIKLSYTEQKLIKEKVQEIIKREMDNRVSTKSLENKIQKGYEKIFELQDETRKNVSILEQLKKEELELTMEVASILVGDDQKLLVKGIEEDTELLQLRMKAFLDCVENFELDKTKFSRQSFKMLSDKVDEKLKEQNESK